MSDQETKFTGGQGRVEYSAARGKRVLDRVEIDEGDRMLDPAGESGIVVSRPSSRVHGGWSVVGLAITDGMLSVAEKPLAEPNETIWWRPGPVSKPDAGSKPSSVERSTDEIHGRDASGERRRDRGGR